MFEVTKESRYPVHIDELLKLTVAKEGSDLHISVGVPPMMRVQGEVIRTEYPMVLPEDANKLMLSILTDKQIKELDERLELDFSYVIDGIARFRGNIMVQRGTLSGAFRVVPFNVPEIETLGLPADVRRLCTLPRGLILVTGPTGSGKSTTLAAIIREINNTRAANILTVEDPIEFLHRHNKSMVCQREVGCDTHSFSNALRQALRHDPDVIMIGEMRDLESISIALTAAETGHLVLSTLHTQTAPAALSRIIDTFPAESKQQVRQQLSGTLQAVLSQQLVPTTDGKRALAVEYLVDTPAMRNVIREGKEHQLYSTMQTGKSFGMQTMDQSLANLYLSGRITLETMMQRCVDTKEIQRLTMI